MSDILIKHMKLPENQVHVILNPNGLVEVLDENNILLEEYQAISVPPHGRLIDGDSLHEELYALEYARENEWLDGVREARGVDAARVALLDAPTIIPAEEDET